jgi:hypothetical protein
MPLMVTGSLNMINSTTPGCKGLKKTVPPAHQHVLDAVDLGRLRQDRGAAVAHQDVHRRAQRRVGADAREAVAAAALQPDAQVLGAARSRAARRWPRAARPRPPRPRRRWSRACRPVSCMLKATSFGPRSRSWLASSSPAGCARSPGRPPAPPPGSGGAQSRPACGGSTSKVQARRGHAAAGGMRERATTPSTFGKAASRSGVKWSATRRHTVAEQFTVEMMPM